MVFAQTGVSWRSGGIDIKGVFTCALEVEGGALIRVAK